MRRRRTLTNVGTPVEARAYDGSRRWAWVRSTRLKVLDAADEGDAGRMLDGCARHCREVLDRSARLHHVLCRAAAVDPDAAALLARLEHQRLLAQSSVARTLRERGALAEGVTEDEALAMIFTMTSPKVHRILTVQRGWPPDRYERWLARSLRALLLPHTVEPPPRRRRC
jgi:hypothetical protein